MEEQKDERLWRIARLRANFKRSFYSYLIVNGFLWCIWWFTTGQYGGVGAYPWPIWPMLGWGLGLGFQYFNAYTGSGEDLTQQEYEKLKKEKESRS